MEQKSFEEIKNIPCETHMVLRRHATNEFLVKSRTITDHELVFVFGGNGVFTVEGEKYPAKAGMLFYFYPGLVHQCETVGPNHVQFYACHFSFHYGNRNTDAHLPLHFINILPDSSCSSVKKLFSQLHQVWKQPERNGIWHCNLLLEQLIFELISSLHRRFISTENRQRAQILSDYIDVHFQEKINISLLCSQIGVKEATLYRLFKEVWGESPMDYIARRRIDAAKELLYTDSCSIERIGQMVGIHDPYYFSRLFRKYVGISPGKYRALFQL